MNLNMNEPLLTVKDIVGDHEYVLASRAITSDNKHKKLITRTHISYGGSVFVFIEVRQQEQRIYSGQDLKEAVDVYNSI